MFILSELQQKNIVEAIKLAETNTSGEIKVHIEENCSSDNPMVRAEEVFKYLSLHKTALRNGVLFYLAYEDRKFAVLGDSGINNKVGQTFWDSTKDLLAKHFKDGDYEKGLCLGVEEAGKQLKAYFPYQSDDKNEISDEISRG
ncbi:TPM domain-containing protein [Lacihabitans sp. LS3-19]|uniref:TPM domain-containing protein n=1 Tax=Lacihabitans sp. LS3-19 TaxID=2487335 RepID=UPI0020CE1CA0|nr:TPM domain-containing protein [Lacihabitans sp. LS3-19]MCP9767488.1 TPM domain-containing protein [Lacihabitans sp. LS3-19]